MPVLWRTPGPGCYLLYRFAARCGPDQSPILLRSEKCHKLLALRLAFDDALQRMSMFAGKLHHLSCFCLGYFLRVGPQSPIPSL